MKTQTNFEIRAYMKGRIFLNILGSQTYNELCPIHKTSAASKTLVFKKVQDVFTNHKYGSRPGQPKSIVTNVYIAALAGLTKRDARLTLQYFAQSVGVLSESTYKILTQQ